MELRVNNYVRTKYGITQFKEYETTNGSKILCMPVKDGSQGIFANVEDVIKSSPNIIDLIEVGDYVNGCRVKNVYSPDGKSVFRIELEVDGLKGHIISKSENIKSILTKEQFESMEYRIGE